MPAILGYLLVGAAIGQTLATYPHVSEEPPLQPYVLPEPGAVAGLLAAVLLVALTGLRNRRRER